MIMTYLYACFERSNRFQFVFIYPSRISMEYSRSVSAYGTVSWGPYSCPESLSAFVCSCTLYILLCHHLFVLVLGFLSGINPAEMDRLARKQGIEKPQAVRP